MRFVMYGIPAFGGIAGGSQVNERLRAAGDDIFHPPV